MRTLGAAFGAIFCAALAAPALAQDNPAQDLVGTWKRDDGRLVRLDWDAQAGEITGTMLEPPENDVTHLKYGVKIRLHREGNKVTGKAIWRDTNPKTKGFPAAPDFWEADALWELELVAPGKLKGRSEGLSFGWGKVTDKAWDNHELDRLPFVTLGGAGKAPERVEAAQPIDEAALAGTWKANTGAIVRFKQQDAGYLIDRVSGSGAFPASIRVTNEANVLRGLASWDGGAETKVELRLTAPGRLEGRAESVEGEKETAQRGWAPFALERLARLDGATTHAAAAEPAPLPPAAAGPLASNLFKRDDGLYLKLTPTATGYTGELVSKTKEVHAKLELAPGPDNKLVGKAIFEVDGAPVEAKWELSPQPDGSLDARCEWLDWDAASKSAPLRGMSGRKFKPLRRVG